MKISNETKVGVLTISALTILILGFNFLKGKDMFHKSKKIYAVFTDLGSLAKSNEVKINGYVIGNIYKLDAKDKNVTGIVATINLTREINIPKDSKAYISTPLVGSSYLIIEKGTDSNYLEPGNPKNDTLKTRTDNGILDDVKAQLTPTLSKVRNSLDSLNMLIGNINGVLSSEAKANLQQTLANLNKASSALNGLLDNQTGALAKTLNNASEITEALKKNTDNVTKTISNAKTASEKLAALDLKPTIDSLNTTISFLKATVAKISSKDGSLGALINDKTLYNKLNDAITSAETLMDDLRAHPKRYVNLSIFGKKDKGGYLTSPLPKDSVRSGNK
jgi:phospholipid/cholesterol/gamma-HCH transport system substrate-binding protein